MSRRTKIASPIAVKWLSEVVMDPNCLSNSFQHYKKFQFENIVAEISDFVLISNADAAEPDTEDGCDVARIVSLYEDSTNQKDPFRAKVQWYSKPIDLPAWCFNNTELIDFLNKEIIEDHRPFNADVSIQTFFKKCSVTFKFTKDTDHTTRAPYSYICRYRLMSMSKRKVLIEPVMEEERNELQLLSTPAKTLSLKMAKTPTSLVKRMSRVSLSEQKDKNWSISKAEGTKLLLKRAILADKTENDTPKKCTPSSKTPRTAISESPKTVKKITTKNLEEILSMELKENSEDELPTLIIRQNVAATRNRRQSVYVSKTNEETPRKSQSVSVSKTSEMTSKRRQSVSISKTNEMTPKRRQSICVSKRNEETPKKTLFYEKEKSPYTTRSGRITKTKTNYVEEVSPVKQTPRRSRKFSEAESEVSEPGQKMTVPLENVSLQDTSFKLTYRKAGKVTESDGEDKLVPKTPAQTPKQTVSRNIISQISRTLRTRAQSTDNIDGKRDQNKRNEETPRKTFVKEKSPYTTRSGRALKTKINYIEQELSPVKQTPRRTRKFSEAEHGEAYQPVQRMSIMSLEDISPQDTLKSILKRTQKITENDDELKRPPKTPKIPKTLAQTPKQTVSRNTISQMSPTLRTRAQSMDNIDGKREQNKINEETLRKTFEKEESPYTTRSGRTTRSKINYVEEELSPVKRTPRRTRKFSEAETEVAYEPVKRMSIMSLEDISPQDTAKSTPRRSRRITKSDDEFKPVPKTPKIPKTPKTPAQTPKQRVSRKLISQMTPTLHSRAHSVDNIDELMREDKSLPGRESQMDEILGFVRAKLLDGSSGCMYISGMPGTGKTATVCSALKTLKDEVDLPEFQLVEVNGMRIAEPRQAYVQIYKQLTGKSVVWEQACTLLEKRFTNPGPRRMPTVLVVDELDALCTRRQDVLYSIMEWAAHNTAVLTVLAVANTMDLPERALASRVASRLGLTRLTFPPYTHAQLQRIVATRLNGANVSADAVQLIARKVAAVSGDARRALALCRRALELAGPAGAGLGEVQRALDEASSGAAVEAVRQASGAERLLLRAVAAEVERTGSEETTLSRALSTAAAIVALDGRPYKSAAHIRAPTPSQALAICSRLAALKLLLLEPKPSEPRLLLNISVDDVHYATRQIHA